MGKGLPRGIFRRRDGRNLWISFGGRRETAGSPRLEDARKLLDIRRAQKIEGKTGVIEAGRVTFEELGVALIQDYRAMGRKNTGRAISILKTLHGFFGGKKANEITTRMAHEYISWRRDQTTPAGRVTGNATINRELSALRRMLSLGAMETPPRVFRVPHIPRLAEPPPRAEFFSGEEFSAVLKALSEPLRLPSLIAYATGMRAGEIFPLQWDRVDVATGRIHLLPGETKNLEGRIVYVPEEIRRELERQKAIQEAEHPSCPFVFHRNGKPIRSYREGWGSACKKAGLPDARFHDLRRTAVRNMVRSGVHERVAMAISGHKTRAVFDRYNIISEGDLLLAAKALSERDETL